MKAKTGVCKNCGQKFRRTMRGWVHEDPDEDKKAWDYGWISCLGDVGDAEPKKTRKH